MEISAGLTPDIREACPMVKGLTVFNLLLASRAKPSILRKSKSSGIFISSNLIMFCASLICLAI